MVYLRAPVEYGIEWQNNLCVCVCVCARAHVRKAVEGTVVA